MWILCNHFVEELGCAGAGGCARCACVFVVCFLIGGRCVCVYLKACECVEQLIQMCYFIEIQQTQCDSVRNHAELNLFHRFPRFCASRICVRMFVCVVLWLMRSLCVCVEAIGA